MRAFSYGTRGHFWSLDKDGGHTIGSAVAENPMLYANFMVVFLLFYRTAVNCRSKFDIAGIRL